MSEPWYKNGLRFECTQCGVCCSGGPGYVWLDNDEILAMAKNLNISVEEFELQFVRLVDGRKSLTERPNYDCVLLDETTRRCSVYEDRPTQCRTWPFWDSTVSSRAVWKQTCRECPGAGKGQLYSIEQIDRSRSAKSV